MLDDKQAWTGSEGILIRVIHLLSDYVKVTRRPHRKSTKILSLRNFLKVRRKVRYLSSKDKHPAPIQDPIRTRYAPT